MKSKTKKYSIFFVVMVMVLVSTLAVKVKAADPTTGSLTIVAKEQQNNTINLYTFFNLVFSIFPPKNVTTSHY